MPRRPRAVIRLAGPFVFALAVVAWPHSLPAQTTPSGVSQPAENGSARATPVPVKLRAWPHDGYGRIVLDWPSVPEYRFNQAGAELRLSFARPADISDRSALGTALRRLDDYLAGIRLAESGRSLVLVLRENIAHRVFTSKDSLVVDLRGVGAGGAEQPSMPVLAVRAGTHEEFSRLVFDWPAKTGVRLERDESEVTLVFDRPGRFDFSAWRRDRPPLIPGLRDEGDADRAKAVLRVAQGSDVRLSESGTSIVVDVLAERAPALKSEPRNPARTESAVRPNRTESRKVAARPPETPRRETAGKTSETPASPPAAGIPITIPRAGPPNEASGAAAEPASRPVTEPVVLLSPQSGAITEGDLEKAVPVDLLATVLADAAAVEGSLPVLLSVGQDGAQIRFLWDNPVGAAVFIRSRVLWVVFDADVPMSFEGWEKTDPQGSGSSRDRMFSRSGNRENGPGWISELGSPQRSRVGGNAVFRMTLPSGIRPTAMREGTTFIVTLDQRATGPERSIPVETRFKAAARAHLNLTVSGAARPIQVEDTEAGDRIWVIPVAEPGVGLSLRRRYAEVELFETAQGIAGRALGDDIVFRSVPGGIEINRKGGLNLSGTDAVAARRPTGEGASSLLLEMSRWQKTGPNSLTEQRHALMRAAALADPGDRNGYRLELAKLHFAFGLYADALGILELIGADAPDLATGPEFRAVRGATRFRMADIEGARDDLFHLSLDPYTEAALWRGAVAAEEGRFADAVRFFSKGELHLATYPRDLRNFFGLKAAAAAIRTGDVGLARYHLEVLAAADPDPATRARMALAEARLAERMADPEAALAAYDRAMAGPDPLVRVEAGLARVDLMRKYGRMEPAEAAAALEKLRFAWRGDGLEFRILEDLGQAYLDAGDVKNGLMALRAAVRNYPDHSRSDALIERMRAAFVSLYAKGDGNNGDGMEPVIALALYDEFRELTPSGPAGDVLIGRLAQRLIDIDLLDRAASLLLHLVDRRLSGVARLRAANRLALVYMLDRKPEKALDILTGQLPGDILPEVATTRRLLTARALGEMARYDEALRMLNGYDSDDAARLRAEISWRTRDWAGAADAYRNLLKNTAATRPLSDRESQRNILSLGISLALAGDGAGLRGLRREYGKAISEGPFADAFGVLTSDVSAVPADYQRISEKIAEVDQFEAFLNSYRDRLFSDPAGNQADPES